jgi:hypothetical protein
MTTAQFITKYDGKRIDFDGVYGAQCLDEVGQYIQEVHGISGWAIARATAYQVWTEFGSIQANQYYDKIPNTPDGVPQEGDIVIWDTSVGTVGHIAAATGEGNTSNFTSFDQNWPGGSACHRQSHDYHGVVGWLRLKSKQGGSMAETAAQVEQRLLHGPGGIDEWIVKTYNAGVQRDSALEQLSQVQAQLVSLSARLDGLVADQAAKTAQIDQLNRVIADKDADITKLKAAGTIPVDSKWEVFKSLIKELLKWT